MSLQRVTMTVVATAVLAVFVCPLAAQDAAPDGSFGTGTFYTWVGAAAFHPYGPGDGTYNSGSFFWQNASGGYWVAPLDLPAGAYLDEVRLFYRDIATDAGIGLAVFRTSSHSLPPEDWGDESLADVSTTDDSATPGGATLVLNPGLTVRYRANIDLDLYTEDINYYLTVTFSGTPAIDIQARGVRLRWKLQISPAPTSASFTDVPLGSQGFAEVEALKASGITAGCTATEFCPNQTVTRKQMAMFLARALGLTWNY